MVQPGSVVVTRRDRPRILICNNEANTVSEHRFDLVAKTSEPSRVLLQKWLDVPDGIAISPSGQIAISNHNTQGVLIYEGGRHLDEGSDPDAIGRGCFYPHGLRFTQDERFLLVADAGAPYVHVYSKQGRWNGIRQPCVSIAVVDEDKFRRGRRDPQNGGPKGLDLDEKRGLLVTSCGAQPLAFFDLGFILESAENSLGERSRLNRDDQSRLQVMWELTMGEARNQVSRIKVWMAENQAQEFQARFSETQRVLAKAMRQAGKVERRIGRIENKLRTERARNRALLNSKSWRITAPLRLFYEKLRQRLGW